MPLTGDSKLRLNAARRNCLLLLNAFTTVRYLLNLGGVPYRTALLPSGTAPNYGS